MHQFVEIKNEAAAVEYLDSMTPERIQNTLSAFRRASISLSMARQLRTELVAAGHASFKSMKERDVQKSAAKAKDFIIKYLEERG